MLKEVQSEIASWPVDIASLQELQDRYADLKGRKARVTGRLRASTYYNCRFGNENTWRSFSLSDRALGIGGIHVYCTRDDPGCESIFRASRPASPQRARRRSSTHPRTQS